MTETGSHSERLLGRIQLTCEPLYRTYRRFWNHRDIGHFVSPFLVLMHQIIRASVPLMKMARVEAAARAGSDQVCAQLAEYLEHHIQEERAHDEWLLQDLETAGIAAGEVLAIAPPAPVAALVGAQYYWILHHHPIALLGYIRLLEGSPPSAEHVSRLQGMSALPPSAFRTYRLHGELDPDHWRELDAFIDALPLSGSQINLLLASATHTAHRLAECLHRIEVTCETVPATEVEPT